MEIDPLFGQLVSSLELGAYTALGKLPHPASGQIERSLPAARHQIDTLAMLQRKATALTPDEARLLSRTLSQLRLNYLDEHRRGDAPQPESAGPGREVLPDTEPTGPTDLPPPPDLT